MYKNLFDKEKKLYCKDICYTFYKDRDIYINCQLVDTFEFVTVF